MINLKYSNDVEKDYEQLSDGRNKYINKRTIKEDIQVETAYISFENGIYKIYNIDDKEGFEINSTNTVRPNGKVQVFHYRICI